MDNKGGEERQRKMREIKKEEEGVNVKKKRKDDGKRKMVIKITRKRDEKRMDLSCDMRIIN